MFDLCLCRAELPFLVFRPAVLFPPDHYRQHLFVNINAGYTAIYWFHQRLLVIARRRTGIDSQSLSRVRPVRSPGLPLVFPAHGPRSNTRTALPYPVRSTSSTAASINSIFIQRLCAIPRRGTLVRAVSRLFSTPSSAFDIFPQREHNAIGSSKAI